MSTTKQEKCVSYDTSNDSDGVSLLTTVKDNASCSTADFLDESSSILHESVTSFVSL